MHLHLSTWLEIESYLTRSRGILIPIGSTEQHGPNGLIGTDSICVTSIANRLGLKDDILVAPSISLGPAQFNLKFPGTISLRPSTLMRLVEDYVLSLESQGFQRFYFINGHGGNLAPVRAAFQEIYMKFSLKDTNSNAPRCRIKSWWEYPETNALRNSLFAEREGLHATPSEISMVQYTFPKYIKDTTPISWQSVPEEYIHNHKEDDHFNSSHHINLHPDGRIGSDPSLANPEDGENLLKTASAELYKDYLSFLLED